MMRRCFVACAEAAANQQRKLEQRGLLPIQQEGVQENWQMLAGILTRPSREIRFMYEAFTNLGKSSVFRGAHATRSGNWAQVGDY